jgi:hypothetical protein
MNLAKNCPIKDCSPRSNQILHKYFYIQTDINVIKGEKILKGSLDSIPSPSPSVNIQIIGGKV